MTALLFIIIIFAGLIAVNLLSALSTGLGDELRRKRRQQRRNTRDGP